MLVNIFLILVCYSVIKIVREPLILLGGGARNAVLRRCRTGTALDGLRAVLQLVCLTCRPRLKLLIGVTLFFIINIQLFALAVAADASYVGILFFVWVGIFSISLIAQFWSFANDICTKEAGNRLFPIITIGMTAGAPLGSVVAGRLFGAGVEPQLILQVSAALLFASWILLARQPTGGPPHPHP